MPHRTNPSRLRRRRLIFISLALLIVAGIVFAIDQLPAAGAGALLHPARHRVTQSPPATCEEATLAGFGLALKGWRCHATGTHRGTIVYLHGVADNRTSGAGVIQRFGPRGFDVIAYDGRGHGESEGDACTYGFFEKQDLRRVLDTVKPGPIVLIGTSLGGAVALQAAADDPRVTAVVAAEVFSDLSTVAHERAPFIFTDGLVRQALQIAGELGQFDVDAVSPERAAARIAVPVILIHGANDVETSPAHSQRVFAALRGPKRLVLVPGAGHNGSLRSEVWQEIESWIDEILAAAR